MTQKHRNMKKQNSKPGDLVVITCIAGSRVIVESLHDDKSYIEVQPGTMGMLVRQFDSKAHVLVEGFLGWVFHDEWVLENI